MRTLLDRDVAISYSQIYVESRRSVANSLFDASFAGQTNGLCGARVHGSLVLNVGLHTGPAPFTIELHQQRPELDTSWEDIVEASFWASTDSVSLIEWSGRTHPLAGLTCGEYRVRFSGRGLDAGNAKDVRSASEPAVDRYLLQFWREGLHDDVVIRQTSSLASYWHSLARAEAAQNASRVAEEAVRSMAIGAGQAAGWNDWGGSRPADRLLELGCSAQHLASADRAVVDAIAAATPVVQRQIAMWSARRAFEMAGIAQIDWIAPAVAALESDKPLPVYFDDAYAVYSRLAADERVPRHTVVRNLNGSGPGPRVEPVLPALYSALDADPLQAAIAATFNAGLVAGPDYRQFLDELRTIHFPSSS